jgi:hypothetical protein
MKLLGNVQAAMLAAVVAAAIDAVAPVVVHTEGHWSIANWVGAAGRYRNRWMFQQWQSACGPWF